MVVGNGMIAHAFSIYKDDEEIVIYASGVSNSKEDNNYAYQREFELLKEFVGSKKLVYFSTISIFDKSLKESKYINHKLKIENFIKENFKNYLIFRLPNVVGKSGNPNTSFNYFKNKIVNNEEFDIQKNATRYFIDVEDLSKILPIIISKETNKIINTCFNNKLYVTQMICFFEELLQIEAKKSIIEEGEDYTIDNSYFMNIMEYNNFEINKDYNKNLIKKYLN